MSNINKREKRKNQRALKRALRALAGFLAADNGTPRPTPASTPEPAPEAKPAKMTKQAYIEAHRVSKAPLKQQLAAKLGFTLITEAEALLIMEKN
jgi:hypothetical protein